MGSQIWLFSLISLCKAYKLHECSHGNWASLCRKWGEHTQLVGDVARSVEAQQKAQSAIKGRKLLHSVDVCTVWLRTNNSSLCLLGLTCIRQVCEFFRSIFFLSLVLGWCSALLTSTYNFSSAPVSIINQSHLPPSHREHFAVNSVHCRCTWISQTWVLCCVF